MVSAFVSAELTFGRNTFVEIYVKFFASSSSPHPSGKDLVLLEPLVRSLRGEEEKTYENYNCVDFSISTTQHIVYSKGRRTVQILRGEKKELTLKLMVMS